MYRSSVSLVDIQYVQKYRIKIPYENTVQKYRINIKYSGLYFFVIEIQTIKLQNRLEKQKL